MKNRTLSLPFLLLAPLLLAGSALISGQATPSVFAARQGQDVDLCALLPSGEGLKVEPAFGDNGRFRGCHVSDNRRGEKHTFFYFTISKYGSVQAAHREVSGLENSPSGLGKWVPTEAFGDPGFAYEMAAVPPSDPSNPANTQASAKLKFARGPYVATGDAGWKDDANYTLNEAGEIRSIAVSVDGALNAAVGPVIPDATATATEVTIPGATATETTEAEVDLVVDHIEVVQVVQRQGNEIPLVAGKKTVVRVFVQASSKTLKVVNDVRASLFVWPEGKNETEVQPANGPIRVDVNAAPKRDQTDSSINFVIPSDLTAAGFFSVKAVVNPAHSVAETNYDNNDHREPLEFKQRNGLRVGFVRIGYKPPGTTQWAWPGTNIPTYDDMMRKLFPAASADIQYYELPWRVRAVRPLSSTDLGDDLNWTLREFYDRMSGDKPDILVGWLPNDYANTLDFGGLAETVVSGQVARVALAVDFHSNYSSHHVLPHEVAHNLGLKHTATKSDPTSDCRLAPNDDPNYWPKEYNDSATIHEVGFDTETLTAVPSNYYDLMSYCGASKAWISPFHYKKLFDLNLRPQAAFTTNRANVIWVRGWASVKGDAAQIEAVRPPDAVSSEMPMQTGAGGGRYSASFAGHLALPIRGQGSVEMQSEGTGDHCLRLMDAGGAMLYERCFDLQFRSEETLQPIERAGFVLDAPDTGKVANMLLIRKGGGQEKQLVAVPVSSHAPKLTITSPKAGDRWEGEHTITWSGSDEDGDNLRYDIQYSADGKVSWYPLEVGSRESEYTFSTDEILPSEQTYIRILASDGFNTTATDVGPLVIPQQAGSPSLPPRSGSGPQPQTPPGKSSGGPDAAVIILIAGVGLVVIAGLGFVLVRARRPRMQQAAPGSPYMPTMPGPPPAAPGFPPQQPWNQFPMPPPQPPFPGPVNPAINANFRWSEQEYGRLRGELAAGRLHPQQYQEMLRRLAVRDAHGRSWMLDAQSGRWLVYDGRAWVPADPYKA